MLKERARFISFGLFLLDLAAIAVAFLLAHGLRAEALPWLGVASDTFYPLSRYLPLLPIVLALWAATLARSRLYHSHRTIPLSREAWEVLVLTSVGTALFVLAIYLFRLDERLLAGDKISRLWIGLLAALAFLMVLLTRIVVRLAARTLRSHGLNYRSILIVGASEGARAIAESIDRHRYWGYRILGFLTREAPPAPGARVAGYPVLGGVDELLPIVEREAVDEVIFAVTRKELAELDEPLQVLQELGIVIRLAFHPLPPIGRLEVSDLEGIPLLSFSSAPTSYPRLAVKRALDVAISAGVLVAVAPLFLLLAPLIPLTSRGPVLYRQRRVGLNGRTFTLLKFRTMYTDAELRRRDLEPLNEMDGPVFKMRRDPRVTPVGRWLRRFSLDELPQLWNVLRGDMSLVGPRPLMPDEVSRMERRQWRRLSMRPGMTCLWQVSGRNEVDFESWMALDLEYIDSWSPTLDLRILLRTIPAVLSGRGAF